MTKITITFIPDNVSIRVDQGTNLLETALAAGVHINATCGGLGVCGKCRVKVESGDVESEKTEHLSHDEFDQGYRLACRTLVRSDCTIEIPAESRGPKELQPRQIDMGEVARKVADQETISLPAGWKHDPLTVKLSVGLTPPTLKDNVSDLTRFFAGLRQQHGIQDVTAPVSFVRALPGVLRESDWDVVATLVSDVSLGLNDKPVPWKVVHAEGSDCSQPNLAIALDIGTTTICAQLLDLDKGMMLASKTCYNKQIDFGADVITRIVFAQKSQGAKKLQNAVVSTVNQIVSQVLEEAGHTKEGISCVVAAGNTTMTHLLLGAETRYIREAPYVPAFSVSPLMAAYEIGMDLPKRVPLYVFPSVASYVGGDIVAGILGSGVFQEDALTLYMDIGTNGEVVLGNRDWLACAACSMGPAFEGGGIQHGMRADYGAIEGFHINPLTLEPMILTVGRAKVRGICGSGLISVLSELLSAGVIDPNGKCNRTLSSERIREGRFGFEYVLAWAPDTATGRDIVITEVDMENLIRAKGALFAGCQTLLDSLSLSFQDVERVIIAGAFGKYINLENGKRIGLFPDIPVDRFRFLGNGSLLGARMICLSRGLLREVERVSKMMTNVELSDNQSFMDKYMGALFLPHTDARLFPEVSAQLKMQFDMIEKERGQS
jgi:uncharacterized 2Fe-2S/4Fe-4S cluster protein (DUF4445 family)